MRSKKRHAERGYALPEALIAAAIAAMVLTATAAGIGGAVRLSRASDERTRTVHEAKLIAERLRAGMSDDDALAGTDGWRLNRKRFEQDSLLLDSPPFEIVTVSYGAGDGATFEILTPARGAGL